MENFCVGCLSGISGIRWEILSVILKTFETWLVTQFASFRIRLYFS